MRRAISGHGSALAAVAVLPSRRVAAVAVVVLVGVVVAVPRLMGVVVRETLGLHADSDAVVSDAGSG